MPHLNPHHMPRPFTPWNKGLAVGQKKPLTIPQIWDIKLNMENMETAENGRDLSLFSFALDSMLRGIDVLNLRIGHITDQEKNILLRSTIRQQKTRRPVEIKISTYTQYVLQYWVEITQKSRDDFVFTGLTTATKNKPLSSAHYRTLVKKWVAGIGLDPTFYSTHSLRRTKAALVYEKTKDPEIVRILLGHTSLSTTDRYLGIQVEDALRVADEVKLFPFAMREELPPLERYR